MAGARAEHGRLSRELELQRHALSLLQQRVAGSESAQLQEGADRSAAELAAAKADAEAARQRKADMAAAAKVCTLGISRGFDCSGGKVQAAAQGRHGSRRRQGSCFLPIKTPPPRPGHVRVSALRQQAGAASKREPTQSKHSSNSPQTLPRCQHPPPIHQGLEREIANFGKERDGRRKAAAAKLKAAKAALEGAKKDAKVRAYTFVI